MKFLDLNCDMGESYGTYKLGFDEEAMPLVTSINVACGFHASDPMHMVKTVQLAKKYGVAVGAHPSYPDLVGFGRRNMDLSPAEVKATVLYQLGALGGICQAYGVKMQHVKAHGALYNTAGKNIKIALAIAEAIKEYSPDLYMLCLANSEMVKAAQQTGCPYVQEAFADRAYMPDGSLAPRTVEGSVLHDIEMISDRVVRMALEQQVTAVDGSTLTLNAPTVCVHGDTPGAVEMIKAIHRKAQQAGIQFKAFGEWV